MQYIIIAKDKADKEALNRRLQSRDAHITLGDQMVESGNALFGAVMLSQENTMCGSVYIVEFNTEEELQNWLQNEPYVEGDVWDMKNIEIIPCMIGPSFMKN